eukprot:1157357-Pelagomonas_calceolata.AAC.9
MEPIGTMRLVFIQVLFALASVSAEVVLNRPVEFHECKSRTACGNTAKAVDQLPFSWSSLSLAVLGQSTLPTYTLLAYWLAMQTAGYIISLFYSICAYVYFLGTKGSQFDLGPFKEFWSQRILNSRKAQLSFDQERWDFLVRVCTCVTACVCASVFFVAMLYGLPEIQFIPNFLKLYKQEFGGQRGFDKEGGPNYKILPVGNNGSRKRKRGQRDGEYEANKPHGLTKKIQAAWYQPPDCPCASIGSKMVIWRTTTRMW